MPLTHRALLLGALALVAAVILLVALVRRRRGRRVDQLGAVMHRDVVWQSRRVLNVGETAVYESACAVAAAIDPSLRIWPQVSLGEVVRTEGRSEADREAFRWINSKRADFLVVDGEGWPLAVIEYQGSGHDLGNAAERDAVKRTVLSRVGIHYIEVPAPLARKPRRLDALLDEALRRAAGA
ncbi:DUF2726 domain-containing protein [Pararoseomonas indoligenes]|uniref:DUF2726 domain-containing protein n=1 Tax=Roseomonas indoligenes TaxID=2820811 RepID=A0A940S3Y7_9PROT|nr:DUF2726 domain-containing protein [Pararoseomonas indoligenes]MBP0491429.1 DUF2726 domain-containing protein [Pararoseomonas indoligenes]